MATSTPTAPVFPYTGDPLSTVQMDYIGYFGRAAAFGGANYWETQLLAGGSTQATEVGIAAGFAFQTEATALYPFLAAPLVATPAQINSFINLVFMNLFGRPAASGGLTYWGNQLTATIATAETLGSPTAISNYIANAVGQFIYDVALGAQAADQAVLTAKVQVANYFTAGTETVAQYANALMVQANPSSQVVAGIVATMDGVTPTSAALTASTAAMATYVNYAATHPVIPIVYEAEAFGLAYGEASTTFAANFGPSNAALPNTAAGDNAFAIAAVNAIFGAAATTNLNNQMIQWVHNWNAFYTANPAASGFGSAATAAQIDLAARAAAFGDGLGVAIDPVGIIQSQVINFLNQAAEVLSGDSLATIYGVAIGSIPLATAFTGGTTATGQTFVLTTSPDLLPGLIGNLGTTDTSGNDVIIGQNTGAPATWTLNPADQINAGAGTNTLKLFANGDARPLGVAQGQFPTLNNVKNLWIDHFGNNFGGTALNVTTNQFPNLTAVQLNNVNGGVGADTAGLIVAHQAVTLSNDSTGGNLYQLSSVADTSENVTFSAVGKFGSDSTLDAAFPALAPNASATSAAVTALTIQSTGGANFVNYFGSTNNITTVTFAHNAAGDTAFTGINWMGGANNFAVTTDATAFIGQLILGNPGGATAVLPFGTPDTVATAAGDSGSNLTAATGDTVKLGSGASFFAESAVGEGGFGDVITLLAGHTAIDVIDSTMTNFADVAYTATGLKNAMSLVTNFNLVGTSFASGDILKVGVGAEAIGTAADINGVNGHTYTAVAGHAGFVAGTNLATFLADVRADAIFTPGHVIGYVSGGNTYVVSFDATMAAGHEQVVELVGVSTATALSLFASATGQIHIA